MGRVQRDNSTLEYSMQTLVFYTSAFIGNMYSALHTETWNGED